MSRAQLFATVQEVTGRPIAGASIAVYEPNTTTPIAETLFSDDIGGTTLTNPLMTDAHGTVLAYLDAPRRVDLCVTAVGMDPWTVPDVGVQPDPADTNLVAHVADTDPHGGYQLRSEKDQLSGYPGLTAAGFVLPGQLGSGTPDGTKYLRDDGSWQLPPGVSPTTTRGDTIKRGAAVDERLGIGTVGQRYYVADIGGGVLEPRWGTPAGGVVGGSTSNPTTTSTTFVDLAEMTWTGTPIGTILVATFEGGFSNGTLAAGVYAALSLDGAAEVGEISFTEAAVSAQGVIGLVYRWSGLTPGTAYNIKVRWKVSSGTGTAHTVRRYLVVHEG